MNWFTPPHRHIFILICLLFFSACEKDDLIEDTENNFKSQNSEIIDKEEKMIVLIKQLKNPYSVDAMKVAQQILVDSGYVDDTINIVTTHYYVRLLPKTWEELDNLEEKFASEGNELFDFPLDYELSENGTYYQDPSLPDSVPTWQYTVVPVLYSMPNTQYEIIEKLFLYDDEATNTELEELIEDVSLYLTGNWDSSDDPPNLNKSIKASKWKPSGTIKTQDHQLGTLVPVEGAKVTMRHFFKYAIDYTDQNGYYVSSKDFKKKVQYKIKWVTPSYRIRSGWYGTAWTVGPNQKGAWNVNFTSQDLRHFYSFVHIAAHDFYYHDPFNLKKPNPTPKLKISALDKCGEAVNHHIASVVGGPDNKIYRKTSGDCIVKNSLLFYGHTIHELGHSNHRANGLWRFVFKNTDFTRESWATTVEWAFIMNKYYPNTLNDNSTSHRFLNTWTTITSFNNDREVPGVRFSFEMDGTVDYTTFFIDLMDCDTSNSFGSGVMLYDKVCGYTLKELEYSLEATGWAYNTPNNINAIVNRLKNDYSNPTENNLGRYIEPYINNY